MTKDQLKTFCDEVKEKGVEMLLPQNLSDQWIDLLLHEIEFAKKEEDTLSGTMYAIFKMAMYQRGDAEEITLSDEELSDYIDCYLIALSSEEINRKTEISITHATLENIFDSKRKVGFKAEPMFENPVSS